MEILSLSAFDFWALCAKGKITLGLMNHLLVLGSLVNVIYCLSLEMFVLGFLVFRSHSWFLFWSAVFCRTTNCVIYLFSPCADDTFLSGSVETVLPSRCTRYILLLPIISTQSCFRAFVQLFGRSEVKFSEVHLRLLKRWLSICWTVTQLLPLHQLLDCFLFTSNKRSNPQCPVPF